MQVDLFGSPALQTVSIEEAANDVHVSTATIRNWIKTGYLKAYGKGQITVDSLQRLRNEVIGTEKLNIRANKSKKDKHDHNSLSKLIDSYLEDKDKISELGNIYEEQLSDSYQNKEGIFYTPEYIIDEMFKSIDDVEGKTFCDPCCGSGNFIVKAIEKGFDPNYIYGFDIDPIAVKIAKKRFFEQTGYDTPNIKCYDFLKYMASDKIEYPFDYIFSNPPWGKKLLKEEKDFYSQLFQCGISKDTCSIFFMASLKALKEHGQLGFLLPESFFNIRTFKDVRKAILNYEIINLSDYGKPFKGLLTKAQAVTIRKSTNSKENNIQCFVGEKGERYLRHQSSFEKNPNQIFNFWAKREEINVVEHLYKLPHSTLENNADWALGIVTGNNSKFCLKKPKDGYIPVWKGSDISNNGLKKPTTYISKEFSNYQQVAPLHYYTSDEKIIYKFISSNLHFFYDNQQRFVLNSANILIPKNQLGINAVQLCSLLNSEIINWLFKIIFNTHKVLRKDLEALPLHIGYFNQHKHFSEETYLDYLNLTKAENGTYSIKK